MKNTQKICLTVIFILAVTSLANAAVLEVGPPGGSVGTLGDIHVYPFAKIQDAVDYAQPGDTILIHDGTYDEQVVVPKNLTLQGVEGNAIVKPSSAAKLTQVFTGLWYAGGTKNVAAIIVANVPDGASVTLKTLKVDGQSVTEKPAGADYVAGIFYRETGGTIDTVTMANVTVGSTGTAVRGYGCYISAGTNPVSVEVKGSTITNFDKNGMEVMGDKLTADINNNTITGRGVLPNGDEVQNGVDVGRGAVATVNFNNISNLAYQPEQWWAGGILLIDHGGSGVANNNTITNCQMGIVIQDGSGTAQGNTVNGGTVGLLGLWAQYTKAGTYTVSFVDNPVISGVKDDSYYRYENAAVGAQSWDADVSLTVTISDNQIISGGATTADGIIIGDLPDYAAGSIQATITNNTVSGWENGIRLLGSVAAGSTITGNTITDNESDGSGIHVDAAVDATNVTVNSNNIVNNQTYGVDNLGTGVLNAENNWWGGPNGPYHPVTNIGGLGNNEVSDNVDYDPWCADENCGTTGTNPVRNITKGTTYDTINAAIADADPGDIIEADAGIYHENLAGWKDMEITKSLTLRGAGSGSTIVELSEGNGLGGKMNGVEIRGSNLDVTIEGITFTRRPGNTYATSYPLRVAETSSSFNSLTLKDVEVGYAEAANVILGGNGTFNNIHVEDCNFHHAGTWGFMGSGTINGMVVSDSNFVHNGQRDPGHGVGFDLTGTSSTNVTVTGGNFSNNKQAGINLMRISNSSFTGCVANNNAGAGGGGFGFKLDEWGGKSQNIVFEQCTASGNGLDGITIQPEKDDAIENILVNGCILTGNVRNGVNLCYVYSGSNNPEMTNITIRCCNLSGNGGKGVDVYSWWVPMTITETFDATYNWWGDASGPSGEGGGSGAAVSKHVDFFPWLLSEECGNVTQKAADYVVDDDWAGFPDWTTVTVDGVDYYIGLNAFDTIQEAVDAANDGNSISIGDGNYAPFTVVSKTDLTIMAGSNPVVQGVQSVNTAYGLRDCVVFIKDSVNVVLNQLDIQGIGLGTINPKNYGVICENSSGSIISCTVSPNTSGNMSSTAIGIWDSSVLTVKKSLIENFGRIGILAYNAVTAEVLENEIVGQVYADEGQVNYGIEVEGMTDDPATASNVTIKRNTIYNCDNTFSPEPSWGSSAILINGWLEYGPEADSTVTIVDNDIRDNYNAIDAVKSPSSRATLNNIVGNRVSGVESAPAYDDTTAVFDAEYNWWGKVSGPNDPCGTTETDGTDCYDVSEILNLLPVDGLGNGVSENVIYCAWLIAPANTSTKPCPAGDLDFDCDVDFKDLAILADNWLKGT
jgi:parallel beta-helix repeat protein